MGRRAAWLYVLLSGAILVSGACHAQREDPLSFDVAAVRENQSGSGQKVSSNVPLGSGDVYSPTGGELDAVNFPLLTYVAFAYRMTSSQVADFTSQAPAWVAERRFDIHARTDLRDVTKNQMRRMMQSLLADRFALRVHTEMRPTNVFALTLIRPGVPGPGLRVHRAGNCSRDFRSEEARSKPEQTADGFPAICGGLLQMDSAATGHIHIGASDIPVSTLTGALPSWGTLGRPVVDRTGLTGNIDFSLDYVPRDPDAPARTDVDGEDFREALRRQMGAKLVPDRVPVPVLVLDGIQQLTEN